MTTTSSCKPTRTTALHTTQGVCVFAQVFEIKQEKLQQSRQNRDDEKTENVSQMSPKTKNMNTELFYLTLKRCLFIEIQPFNYYLV